MALTTRCASEPGNLAELSDARASSSVGRRMLSSAGSPLTQPVRSSKRGLHFDRMASPFRIARVELAHAERRWARSRCLVWQHWHFPRSILNVPLTLVPVAGDVVAIVDASLTRVAGDICLSWTSVLRRVRRVPPRSLPSAQGRDFNERPALNHARDASRPRAGNLSPGGGARMTRESTLVKLNAA